MSALFAQTLILEKNYIFACLLLTKKIYGASICTNKSFVILNNQDWRKDLFNYML